MRFLHFIWHTAAVIFITVAIGRCASAGVVTLDVAAKSAVSDTSYLTTGKANVIEGQIGVSVKSAVLTPRKFTLKVTAFNEDDYDLYVNQSFVGVKSYKELTGGIELSIPGRIVDEGLLRCARLVESRVDAELKRLGQPQEGEPQRVSYTLGQARDWTHLIVGKEETYRSVDIILAPAGKMLRQMPTRNRLDAERLVEALFNTCNLLQQARDRMYRVIKDGALRNDAVVAMTPVDLTADYAMANGKPRIMVTIANGCDLPVGGVVALRLPKGWKADTKTLKPIALASGKTFRRGVDLVPPAAGAALKEPVKVSADLAVEKGPYLAKFTLTATAGAAVPK